MPTTASEYRGMPAPLVKSFVLIRNGKLVDPVLFFPRVQPPSRPSPAPSPTPPAAPPAAPDSGGGGRRTARAAIHVEDIERHLRSARSGRYLHLLLLGRHRTTTTTTTTIIIAAARRTHPRGACCDPGAWRRLRRGTRVRI